MLIQLIMLQFNSHFYYCIIIISHRFTLWKKEIIIFTSHECFLTSLYSSDLFEYIGYSYHIAVRGDGGEVFLVINLPVTDNL
jgi:hypothetical protein